LVRGPFIGTALAGGVVFASSLPFFPFFPVPFLDLGRHPDLVRLLLHHVAVLVDLGGYGADAELHRRGRQHGGEREGEGGEAEAPRWL